MKQQWTIRFYRYPRNQWPWGAFHNVTSKINKHSSNLSKCVFNVLAVLEEMLKHFHAFFQLWKGLTSRSQSLYCCCQTGNHQMECITWGLNRAQMRLLGQGQTLHWAKNVWAINQSRDRSSSPLMLQPLCRINRACLEMSVWICDQSMMFVQG